MELLPLLGLLVLLPLREEEVLDPLEVSLPPRSPPPIDEHPLAINMASQMPAVTLITLTILTPLMFV